MAKTEPTTVAIVSLGCPKNLVDSEKMLANLAEGGCLVAAPMEDADVIVVNTCGFLSAAKDESLDVISEALDYKKTGRASRVVVAGCLVNRDAEKLYEIAPGIDAIVGVNNREEILTAVLGDEKLSRTDECEGEILSDAGRFRLTPPHTAYLRISEGCSQRCTFCTIPAIRGPFRSKRPEDVITEAKELIADGAVELNVIGQDTTNYGADLNENIDLAGLISSLNELDGVNWIRLMYAYPKRFSDELIEAMAQCQRVVPYVDLPLQHISDSVLKGMGRRVTRAQTEQLLQKLREKVPGINIRTTFIVGFPGETEQNFEELLDFVKAFRFDSLGVFEFSPEEGTPSVKLPNHVPDEIKASRAEQIMLAQQEIVFDQNHSRVGQAIEVLVDGIDENGYCVARHPGQAPDIDSQCILTEPKDAGLLLPGKVVDFEDYDLIVEIDD